MKSTVAVEQIEFRYGDRVALRDVGFEVSSGLVFGLLGPNGSGKSTLFRLLSTLLPVQHGRAAICGFDVSQHADAARQSIGVTFQSPGLDLKLTVLENLRVQGHLYGLSGQTLRHRCDQVLQQLGVQDRRGDFAETLSGGLKRRVEIAKCLLHAPQVLLLDEPSTGLDPGARYEMWETLFRLRESSGVTILVSTHLMEEAEKCDLIGILDEGRLIALGAPDELRTSIGHNHVTVQAKDADQLLPRLRNTLQLDSEHLHRVDDELRIECEQGHLLLSRIATEFPDEFRSLTLGKPTLEDVFLKLTGRSLSEGQAE